MHQTIILTKHFYLIIYILCDSKEEEKNNDMSFETEKKKKTMIVLSRDFVTHTVSRKLPNHYPFKMTHTVTEKCIS